MAPEHSDDGVDLTLIRWMLSLTPREHLAVLQDQAGSSHSVQSSNPGFLEILRVLTRHRVDFIVVGGVRAVLHGAPVTTLIPQTGTGSARAATPADDIIGRTPW